MTIELYKKLADRLPGAVSVLRIDPAAGKLEYLHFSPRGAEIFGVTDAELRADPNAITKRMVPEEQAQFEAQMGAAMQTGAPIHWTGRITHANGEVHWVESHASVEQTADGVIFIYLQTLDVTERKRTSDALAASEDLRRKSEELHRAVIDALPVGVVVMDTKGALAIINPAQKKMSGDFGETTVADLTRERITEVYGIFEADGITPLDMETSGLMRAMAGENPPDVELVSRNAQIQGETRFISQARPLRDAAGKVVAALAVAVDVTEQRALEREIVTRNEQLSASEEAKTVLIERLRGAVDELSNPILEVWDDVLAMPIIGIIDSRRTADMVRRLLAEVARTQASFVIVDLTGVEIVDTKTADHLMKLMRKVEIVGARCVLTGVRPAVAETLVDIGVDFGRLATLRNLKHGLREALRYARREREGSRDLLTDDEQGGRIGAATARS